MSSVAISPTHASSSARALGRERESSFVTDATRVVLVLDEDVSACECLEHLIRREGWRPEVFGSAQELLLCPPSSVPNCLVLDARSCPDALDLQKRLALDRPGTPIIFMGESVDISTTVKAMKAGAVGVFTKPVPEDALLNSIREALERSNVSLAHEMQMRALRDRYSALSCREREVMALVASGLLNKQVGGELGISEITVKAHRGQVMHKMKASSIPHLVRMAVRLRLTAPQ
jgi:FixJ family two-component response regulator